jgi:outer membrane protein assembly factor BamB
MIRSSIDVCLTVLALARVAADDQWPQFRGRTSGVAADNPRLPDTWSRTTNVVWSADVPGIGWSSPVVWDDLIVLTSVIPTGAIELP